MGLLALNAVCASNEIIVPIIPQYLSLEGLATLTEALERIKAGISCQAKIMGILLTQVDARSKAVKEIITLIREHYGQKVFRTEVKTNVRLAEAPSHGKSIFQYDWSSNGALAYQSLANEVIKHYQANAG